MALTNAEKQARYRERHLENGTKTRGHFFLEATADTSPSVVVNQQAK
jgi:hypothetical protein